MKKKIVRMMQTVVPSFFLLVLGIVLLNPVPTYASTPTICVDPPLSYAAPGESFNITWSIQDAVDVYAWSVNLSFNPNILEFQNIVEGDFLENQPEGTSGILGNAFAGYIWYCVSTKGNHTGVDGSGTLAIVEFKAREGVTGGTILNISDPGVWDPVHHYHVGGTQLLDHLEMEIPRITVNGFFVSTQLLPFYDLFVALNSSYYSLLADYNTLLDDYNSLLADYDNLQDSYNTLATSFNTQTAAHSSLAANYTNLQDSYDSLSSNYDTLQAKYSSLESSYNTLQSQHDALTDDLNTATNLNYLFIAAIIAFIIATVYLAIRKPKPT